MVPGWLAGFLGCVRDPVADSIQNLCDPRISGKSAFFRTKTLSGTIRRAFLEAQTFHPREFCKGYWGFGNRLPENGDSTSTKWSSRNGRHQKLAFGVDETLICNLHLGSAGRLRPLCRASQNGKVKVVRDFCESVVVFESEFPIMPSGSSVPKHFGSGTIWSFN